MPAFCAEHRTGSPGFRGLWVLRGWIATVSQAGGIGHVRPVPAVGTGAAEGALHNERGRELQPGDAQGAQDAPSSRTTTPSPGRPGWLSWAPRKSAPSSTPGRQPSRRTSATVPRGGSRATSPRARSRPGRDGRALAGRLADRMWRRGAGCRMVRRRVAVHRSRPT